MAAVPLLAVCRFMQSLSSTGERKLSRFLGVNDPRRYTAQIDFPGLHADRKIFVPDLFRFLAPSTDRVTFFSKVGHGDKNILEIGPLHSPICSRPAVKVKYIDAFSTEKLKEHYKNDQNVDATKIVDVDFVWQGGPYRKLIRERFDSVVTSHNIEHVPCLVSFLKNLESVLNPGGRIYLAIPDKRYCFDHFKAESSISDVLDAFFSMRRSVPAASLLRQALLVTHNDAMRHWAGDHGKPMVLDPKVMFQFFGPKNRKAKKPLQLQSRPFFNKGIKKTRFKSNLVAGLRFISQSIKRANKGDQHVWVFTPGSFMEIIFLLNKLGLINLSMEHVHPTAFGSHEFYATLIQKKQKPLRER